MMNNTTASVSSWTLVWASGLITLEAVVALTVNSYLFVASYWLRRPVSVNLLLCVSLSASDAVCAFFYVLSTAVNGLLPYAFDRFTFVSNCWTLLIEAFKLAAFLASVLHLLALAVNHYIGIVYPFNRNDVTGTGVKTAIFAAYIVPLSAFMLVFSIVPDQGFRGSRAWGFWALDGCSSNAIFGMFWYRAFVVAPFIVFIVVVTCLYTHILVHMRNHARDPLIRSSTRGTDKHRHAGRKLLVTLVLLAGSAIVGWLPTMVQYVVFCESCLLPCSRSVLMTIGVTTQVLNVLKLIMDAFIYASRLVEIRYALWQMHDDARRWLCPGASQRQMPTEYLRYLTETKQRRPTNNMSAPLLERTTALHGTGQSQLNGRSLDVSTEI